MSVKEQLSVVYKYQNADLQIRQEHQDKGYMVNSIEINNGIFAHIDGMEYPEKGIVPTEDLWHVNIVKKLIIDSIKISVYFIPTWIILALLPFSLKQKILNSVIQWFNSIGFKAISAYILKDEHLTPMAQELKRAFSDFLKELGLEHETFPEIIANVINQDNAYRYRIQDLFQECDKFVLYEKPHKEIIRLMKVHEIREHENGGKRVTKSFRAVGILVSVILLHPGIRRAFRRSILNADFNKLRPDTMDWFWMSVRGGYHYFGKTNEQRRMDINHLKVCKPSKI